MDYDPYNKDPHWTVEEAMKMVISGGIIGPESINIKNNDKKSG